MKLVSFSESGSAIRPGALIDDAIVDLHAQGFDSVLDVITSGQTPRLDGERIPLRQTHLHAPLANPPRIFCVGLNYRDHAIESGMVIPKTPVIFFKLPTAIIGPGESIVLPANTTQPDYEAEFAFVIGRGGYRIPSSQWRKHVYGYTMLNDVSARDIQLATSQWTLGKSLPTFCPLGPAIVTSDEIEDPHALDIKLEIDGETLQSSNTRELIFNIPTLVEFLSSITHLLPGDIISTGTPEGVGLGRTPKRWLKPGEMITMTISGLGSLTNPVKAE